MRPGAWPFDDPPNLAVFTTRAVLEDGLPVLLVSHDEDDGSWQFLCGTTNETEQLRVIALHEALERDPGLAVLAGLPLGWIARRRTPADTWIQLPHPADEE